MKPMSGNEIVGNWGTLMLPINEDERIDFTRLEQPRRLKRTSQLLREGKLAGFAS